MPCLPATANVGKKNRITKYGWLKSQIVVGRNAVVSIAIVFVVKSQKK
jgi:hypothetical protein